MSLQPGGSCGKGNSPQGSIIHLQGLQGCSSPVALHSKPSSVLEGENHHSKWISKHD